MQAVQQQQQLVDIQQQQQQQKRGVVVSSSNQMEDSKLNRLINDSKQRRSRAAREVNKVNNVPQNNNGVTSNHQQQQQNSNSSGVVMKSPNQKNANSSNVFRQQTQPSQQQQQRSQANQKKQISNPTNTQQQISSQSQVQKQNDIKNVNNGRSKSRGQSIGAISKSSQQENSIINRRRSSHISNKSGNSNNSINIINNNNRKIDTHGDEQEESKLSNSLIKDVQSDDNNQHNDNNDTVQQIQRRSPSKQLDDDNKSSSGGASETLVLQSNNNVPPQLHDLLNKSYDKNPVLDPEFMKEYNRQLQQQDIHNVDEENKSQQDIFEMCKSEDIQEDDQQSQKEEHSSERNEFEVASNDISLSNNQPNANLLCINDSKADQFSHQSIVTPQSIKSLDQQPSKVVNKNKVIERKQFNSSLTNVKPALQKVNAVQKQQQVSILNQDKLASKSQTKRATIQNDNEEIKIQKKHNFVDNTSKPRKSQLQESNTQLTRVKTAVTKTISYEPPTSNINPNNKSIKSKVNTGISRSKSAYGQRKIQSQSKDASQIQQNNVSTKFRLDLSPSERIKDDLERQIKTEVKEGIKGIVNDKYADLERMLQTNMGDFRPQSSTGGQEQYTNTFDSQENGTFSQNQTSGTQQIKTFEDYQLQDSNYKSLNNDIQKSTIVKSSTHITKIPNQNTKATIKGKQGTNDSHQQLNQTPKNRVSTFQSQTQRNDIQTKTIQKEQTKVLDQQVVMKVQKKPTKVMNQFSPDKIQRPIPEQKQETAAKKQTTNPKTVVPKLDLNKNAQNSKSQKTLQTMQVVNKKSNAKVQSQLPQNLSPQKSSQYQSNQSNQTKPTQQPKQNLFKQEQSRNETQGTQQLIQYDNDLGDDNFTSSYEYNKSKRQQRQQQQVDDSSPDNLPVINDDSLTDAYTMHNKGDISQTFEMIQQRAMKYKQQNNPNDSQNTSKDRISVSVKDIGETYGLKTREDFLNFSIEKIWAEMDQISKNKKENDGIFKDFQEQFYDRKQPCFYDQEECSPTKRLIQMKNSVTKHHNIQHTEGINDDEQYSIQYTTQPGKSYVVKPDDGKIDYDFNQRKTHLFVEKVINGQVEKIQIQEERSPKRASNKHSLIKSKNSSKSPVKITQTHGARGASIVQSSANYYGDDGGSSMPIDIEIVNSGAMSGNGSIIINSGYGVQKEVKRRSIVEVLGHQYQQNDEVQSQNSGGKHQKTMSSKKTSKKVK